MRRAWAATGFLLLLGVFPGCGGGATGATGNFVTDLQAISAKAKTMSHSEALAWGKLVCTTFDNGGSRADAAANATQVRADSASSGDVVLDDISTKQLLDLAVKDLCPNHRNLLRVATGPRESTTSTSESQPATLTDGATDLNEVRAVLANSGVRCVWTTSTFTPSSTVSYPVAVCETKDVPVVGSTGTEYIGVYVGNSVDAYVGALRSDGVTGWGIRGSNWVIDAEAVAVPDEHPNIVALRAAIGFGEVFPDSG